MVGGVKYRLAGALLLRARTTRELMEATGGDKVVYVSRTLCAMSDEGLVVNLKAGEGVALWKITDAGRAYHDSDGRTARERRIDQLESFVATVASLRSTDVVVAALIEQARALSSPCQGATTLPLDDLSETRAATARVSACAER